ncbi:MAG: molybdopterin synthase sulfur carrier subunit [Deltaproteobacteria bacterium]|nr:MAG: molybdopterin synthase sulfur carrier subunit [Deltaproteobacteria bacterium]
MQLTVKLFASFRDNRFKQQVMEFSQGTTVADILDFLGIDSSKVGVTMINSRHCTLDQTLCEDDIVAIFPVIGGG